MGQKNIFILDTSVLLYDMHAIHSFPKSIVVIPFIVLDEIDRFKDRPDYVGACARYVNRFLDELRVFGDLNEGIEVNHIENIYHDQVIRVELDTTVPKTLPEGLSQTGDNKIISCTLLTKEKAPKGSKVTLITKDINLRVKCDSLKIASEDYLADHIEITSNQIYAGKFDLELTDDEIDSYYSDNELEITEDMQFKTKPLPNSLIVAKSPSRKNLLAKFDGKLIKPIRFEQNDLINVKPRNKEQKFALDLLYDKDIELVSISGIAGSGKTYLTLVAAMSMLWDKKIEQIVITRSIQPVGKEMGHLPGDLMDKMNPWLSPILDNFRHAFIDKDRFYFNQLIEKGQIEVAPLAYIRGRTFNDSLVIVDEAQNATIHELKTIITRIGPGSKVVLLGDTDQVDTPYINSKSNGLTIVIEKLKESNLTGHITLIKGQRSNIASLASKIL